MTQDYCPKGRPLDLPTRWGRCSPLSRGVGQEETRFEGGCRMWLSARLPRHVRHRLEFRGNELLNGIEKLSPPATMPSSRLLLQRVSSAAVEVTQVRS